MRSIFHDSSSQSLRARHIHRLNIAVQLLLRTLLVISLSRNSDTQSVRYAFDAGFPDFLVQLWVKTDVNCSLYEAWFAVRGGSNGGSEGMCTESRTEDYPPQLCVPRKCKMTTYHRQRSKLLDLFDSSRSPLLERDTMNLFWMP